MSLTGIPLTTEQKVLPSGALLPSGESNFFDFRQDYSARNGQGINTDYPSPFFAGSGKALIATNPPTSGVTTGGVDGIGSGELGMLAYNNVSGLFSNAAGSLVSGITDFTIFNDYIHYYGIPVRNVRGNETVPVTIPYLSDYTVASGFDIYDNINYQYFTYSQLFGNT